MADFDRVGELDQAFRFLEAPELSLPLDKDAFETGRPLVGVKSNIRVTGQAWTAGIAGRRDRIADSDADVVAAFRRAGAAVLSRLNMDEAALGAACRNPSFRTTLNPRDPRLSAGGSSGGAAAAVAAGACDLALGTDTLGSVRIPAAYCGVYGLKLGWGAFSMEGVFPLAPSLDSLGFLAADPGVLRSGLSALSIADESAISRVSLLNDVGTDRTVEAAASALARAGWPVARTALGLDPAAVRGLAFLQTEIEAAEALAAETGLSSGLAKLLAYGATISGERREGIAAGLADARARLLEIVGSSGCLLLPTVAEPAFPVTDEAPRGQADFTALANVAGLPALSVPFGTADGKPASVQLVGPKGSENALIGLADSIGSAQG